MESVEALKILEEKLREKKKACWNEIGQIMEKYGFQFDIATIMKQGKIMHQIDLLPKEE